MTMIETMTAGEFYRSARNPGHLYKVLAICGQKVTVELHSVDGVAVPAAEPVELSLGRARGSFVPLDGVGRSARARTEPYVLRELAE
jgi:hypothetical protein